MEDFLQGNIDFILEDDNIKDVLFEKNRKGEWSFRRGGLSKVGTAAVMVKIKGLENQIRRSKQPEAKMNLLAKQNFYVGLLISISINSKLTRVG